jgi:protein TonB
VSAQTRSSRWLPAAIGGLAIVIALALVWLWARHMMAAKPTKVRQVPQVVQIIRPPPEEAPPPPPPPPPEKVEEPLPQDTPDPQPAADNAPEQLGLDADASAGGDAFGLVARKGGTDLVGTGTAIFGRYTTLLKDAILDKLSEDERLRSGSYSVTVRVWVASDGRIERVALMQASGKKDVDNEIQQQLTRLARVSEAPPIEMPQPVTLRIVSRG